MSVGRSDPAPTPEVLRSIAAIRDRVESWRRAGARVALVPTMGALHPGHLSLVERARTLADRVVVSIFVNPAQFAPHEDFGTYPRTWEADIECLSRLGTEAVFAPAADDMYPPGFATTITVAGPAQGLESDSRPHFFAGVATVVAKLLLGCRPDVAVFGEKDYQQLLVVRRLARDLDLSCKIEGAPTMREADGLAMSSRNRALSVEHRALAPLIYATLRQTAAALARGAPQSKALARAAATLEAKGFALDYLALRDARTLEPVNDDFAGPRRLLAAARLGGTRLIDNVAL